VVVGVCLVVFVGAVGFCLTTFVGIVGATDCLSHPVHKRRQKLTRARTHPLLGQSRLPRANHLMRTLQLERESVD
jgi:hypothetical protein